MKKLKTWVRQLMHKLFPEKFAALYDKAEEVLWYAFFGVLTTSVNFAVYLVMTRLVLKGFFEEHEAAVTLASNWVAWSVAVLFAFFVNKSYVFENKEGGKSFRHLRIIFVKLKKTIDKSGHHWYTNLCE